MDEENVKQETNLHYQTVAGAVNQVKLITDRFWAEQYTFKPSIDDNIYTDLLDFPTFEELQQYIKLLPNQKASGPLGILNEMLKHFGQIASTILLSFFHACIKIADFPQQWKKATIYPIAKSKPSDVLERLPMTFHWNWKARWKIWKY
ncbi:hypothetical protein RclHR1_24420002 [Rhizophagus clarus]|uniref:Reverse transcriptase domain-containing protein n=1 Tax=Rhizophagus clarus TaxID=94130 RepID=A0A2Z6RS89_9GLOM|nr:hypothetical protein RclHR1_24420002 [Rhizophagus clarus]GES89817.1 hypothetical protein RCL_jg12662.t1 [Rhizophagus clarus]